MTQKYSLWVDTPGNWVGWVGFVADDIFVPHKFDHDEAQDRVRNYRECARRHKGYDVQVDVVANPPDELPWNRDEWQKAVKTT